MQPLYSNIEEKSEEDVSHEDKYSKKNSEHCKKLFLILIYDLKH